jgi:hypothetical protein
MEVSAMGSIVIKIIDRNSPGQVAEALGELEGAGFEVVMKSEADYCLVDVSKVKGNNQDYDDCVVLIGHR